MINEAVILIVLVVASALYIYRSQISKPASSSSSVDIIHPPRVPYSIPILGSAIEFGLNPVKFLQQQRLLYGDCFTFKMMGRNMTFCLGDSGNHFVFNVRLKDATAEGAYLKLTRPVFGDQVIYDVPNSVFMEQKKFVKDALTTNAFKSYVPVIVAETHEMIMNEWKDKNIIELFPIMAELTIRTASSCLMGKEIRDQLHIAKLFHDLDCGLTPLNVFVEYLPLPRFINRDRANKELTNLFLDIIEKRKEAADGVEKFDVLQTLMTSTYKAGSMMGDVAVAHMMIALLMAGQHTSSTTATWMLFEIAKNQDLLRQLREEQSMVLTGKLDTPHRELPALDFDSLKNCILLDQTLKETLRIHPPIHTVMRLVEQDLKFNDYTIPKGHFLCSGITVGHLDETKFPKPMEFIPLRHAVAEEASSEWTIGGVDIAQKSAKNHYLPFGAGRHRCIGEHFAFIQNKTIVATILNEFDIKLVNDVFPKSDFTQLIVLPVKGSNIAMTRRS